ncbi:hypothetical protein LOC00_10215, partial [Lactobacillus delbrueckii subsp. lactis]|nr:hypothetical protein [Lactobacillus delbrueckii subsp. lactis]
SPSKVHARGIIAITSSLIEYLLAKLLSFQGFIVLFGVGSLSNLLLTAYPINSLNQLMLISHKLLLKVLYYLIYQPFRGFR